MKNLEFTLQGNVVPVVLRNEGQERKYELREMSAAARDRYLDLLGSRLRVDSEGRPAGIKKFDGMQAELLSMCLWDVEAGTLVAKDVIQKWPANVVSGLYAEAQEMHRLPSAEDDAAKNG